jgi:dTDP-4-amino-4,6-dideoxygalactose transaminase
MSDHTDIPFLDLVTPHMELEQELTEVFQKTLQTGRFIGGPMVEEFEQAFADLCDAKYAVGVSSGTDALRFALMACGVQPGDVVVTVPNTFIATTEAISQAGAFPEFVDVDERTYNMDPAKLREYLERQCDRDPRTRKPVSRRTRRTITAIVPVHLYGQTADMDPILELAKTYNLVVVEDACQAHGAEYLSQREDAWKKAGSMGMAGAFSFYPGKNLGACGEAGAVTTNDLTVARKVRQLRDHGQTQKYYHEIQGYNGRLDAIQAGILAIKLRYLKVWNQKRRDCAATYGRLLAPVIDSCVLPYDPSWVHSIYHLYVIRIANREGFRVELANRRIGTAIHYPVPLHLQNAHKELAHSEGDFPVCERVAREIISLPMYPQLRLEQQQNVAEAIFNFLETNSGPLSLHLSSQAQ